MELLIKALPLMQLSVPLGFVLLITFYPWRYQLSWILMSVFTGSYLFNIWNTSMGRGPLLDPRFLIGIIIVYPLAVASVWIRKRSSLRWYPSKLGKKWIGIAFLGLLSVGALQRSVMVLPELFRNRENVQNLSTPQMESASGAQVTVPSHEVEQLKDLCKSKVAEACGELAEKTAATEAEVSLSYREQSCEYGDRSDCIALLPLYKERQEKQKFEQALQMACAGRSKKFCDYLRAKHV